MRWRLKTGGLGRQRNFLLEPGRERCRYLWHLPNRNAPVGRPKKPWCGPTAILRHRRAAFSVGKVTRRGRFANRWEQDIIAGQAKLSFFSRYLRIHLDGRDAIWRRSVPRPG